MLIGVEILLFRTNHKKKSGPMTRDRFSLFVHEAHDGLSARCHTDGHRLSCGLFDRQAHQRPKLVLRVEEMHRIDLLWIAAVQFELAIAQPDHRTAGGVPEKDVLVDLAPT